VNGYGLERALAQLGYAEFRPGQREAVDVLLGTGRLLLIAPTGGGKSLVYQLPALLLQGTSVVVSPLISLMQDQVTALAARGVAATYLASTLPPDENQRRAAQVASGAFKLVYLSPERLALPAMRALLRRLRPPLVAIDEAHCISEWGHDFRPEYLELGALLAELGPKHALACTATATPVVRDEILARLGLPADTPQLVRGFARPNLVLGAAEVADARERRAHVDALLARALGSPSAPRGAAIVYAPTRRAADAEAERLGQRGWRTRTYHAGLDGSERAAALRAFQARETDVVTATNAFGMGIDRADVRAVVHLAPPGSIEAYYQEVGRAGRDGATAYGLLLLSPGDLGLRRRLLEQGSSGDEAPERALFEHRWGLFLELVRWVEGGSCRHDAILRYFGDESAALDGCGRCDVCCELGDGAQAELGADDVQLLARKALSAVARVQGRFGLQVAALLLRGTSDARIVRAGLDRTPTFGVLREHSDDWVLRLLRRCVSAGWVELSGGDRPVVALTSAGRAVMRAERPARLLLPRRAPRPVAGEASAPARAARAAQAPADPSSDALFEALRAHRLALAREEHVPPYRIASDRALREIAQLLPRTPADLELAHGIGPAKAARYGEGLLAIVAAHLAAREALPQE
jgi:ATP-dependent DNA helicase RecQ